MKKEKPTESKLKIFAVEEGRFVNLWLEITKENGLVWLHVKPTSKIRSAAKQNGNKLVKASLIKGWIK